ncbi:MAG: helix-turn-helix transcriptional regulator [Nitriliruptorales bacterium]|nr:helix-turn-helix transcriptional regulator [Nitriliruptorales bacterium]
MAATEETDLTEIRCALGALRRSTGLPLAFGGAMAGSELRISELNGLATRLLHGLVVPAGAGLGGKTLALRRPAMVNDYQHAKAISHHYDRIVRAERIVSLVATPVLVRRELRGVLYAGTRDGLRIGERAVGATIDVARDLEQDIAVREEAARRVQELMREAGTPPRKPSSATSAEQAIRQAHGALRSILHQIDDDALRRSISAACDTLTAATSDATDDSPPPAVALTARELDVLSCVALGHTNAEAAAELGLRPETVKSYLRNTMRKLGVNSRIHTINAARQQGLLP